MKKTVVWENLEILGIEYMELDFLEEKIDVNSHVINVTDNIPNKVVYNISLDRQWGVREVSLGTTYLNKSLHISTNGKGIWFDENGSEIISLTGAIDIDISCTPFTNSLPINRLKWEKNVTNTFQMVYISLPDLTLKKINQSYKLISHNSERREFYYKSGEFEALIEVDNMGLITNYPGVFKRRF